jgi:molybdate transport system substrate-binding protein
MNIPSRPWLLALVLASLALPAVGAQAASLKVAAAADLKYALDDIIAAYRQQAPDTEVKVSYGSSGTFFAQLSNGAPFDLFLSADISYPRTLVEAGVGLEGSDFPYAIGRLVLWVPRTSKLDVERLGMKVLLDPSVRRIAIANPAHAPYGRAAEAALRSAGVYEAVQGKLVTGNNISQAAQFVQSGNADVGILALSLALAPPMQREGRYWQVPLDAFPRMEQGGVLIAASRHPEAARAFVAFLTGAPGRAILSKYGFELPARQ